MKLTEIIADIIKTIKTINTVISEISRYLKRLAGYILNSVFFHNPAYVFNTCGTVIYIGTDLLTHIAIAHIKRLHYKVRRTCRTEK